ncbi:choice-of-anchor Q domain-containing protein, partial [Clostridium tagluense]|uniref:choice-of-anchor Q domain-containing protein n=1 Tax=Clostridium tagluense TaxID=360422 RepID=UPI00299F05BA
TTSDRKVTRWGKSVATNDNYTAPVAATGMTVEVLAKVPASENKVMLTVSTAASDANHKVYYRVVDADPSAMNVGDVITTANWTEVADTSAHETSVEDGKFVEIVEVTTSDNKATRWGKSVATNDEYAAATSIVVKNLNDSGTESLRQAIADIEAGGTIAFDAGLSGEIKLQSCININKNVKITGPADGNLTVSGENSYRIFNIDSGKNVEISYFKFTKGSDDAYLNNLNDYGGAIHNEGNLKINYSEFSGNNAFCSGGAITTWENSTLTINNSTFNNNNAGRIAYGGSIYAYLDSNVTINNSTFNGNSATNQGFGGAIWIEGGNLAVNSSTISGNTAGTGGGICGGTNANITLKNTIVSDNGTEDIRGSVTANYSLISTTTGCAITNSDNNITGQSANLGTLADNGGITKTMMPNAGSPVIDAGDDIGITETDTDQRGTGNLRKKGTHVDIGAVETGISAVAATGMTVEVFAKVPASEGKVRVTVSTAASDANHKVYRREVDTDPSAMNVGDVITPSNWTEVLDTSAQEANIVDGKFVEVVEVTTADRKVTRWGKSVVTDDEYTASVAATGMTVEVFAKVPASENKVMLTVSTAASDANHKVYRRVVSVDPSAMNVGDVITPSNWTEVLDTSAQEANIVDGKFVEVVEVTTADRKVTRWGKSVVTDDEY